MTEPPRHPWTMRVLLPIAAAVGMVGWVGLMLLGAFWLVQPAGLPRVEEPIEVLNPGNRVAVGDTLVMRLEVAKSVPREPVDSARWLECESGNLVTLTATISELPVGVYTVISDSVVIPAKVAMGDTCKAVLSVDFRVNPIRVETLTVASEPFTIEEAAP